MKTYTTGTELAEAIRAAGERSIWIEVDASMAGTMMGQEFTSPDGHVITLEQVSLFRAENGVLAGDPVFIKK